MQRRKQSRFRRRRQSLYFLCSRSTRKKNPDPNSNTQLIDNTNPTIEHLKSPPLSLSLRTQQASLSGNATATRTVSVSRAVIFRILLPKFCSFPLKWRSFVFKRQPFSWLQVFLIWYLCSTFRVYANSSEQFLFSWYIFLCFLDSIIYTFLYKMH